MQTAAGVAHSLVNINANVKPQWPNRMQPWAVGWLIACKKQHKPTSLPKCKYLNCRQSCPFTCKKQCRCKASMKRQTATLSSGLPHDLKKQHESTTCTTSKYANCRRSWLFTCKNQCRCKAAMSQRTGTVTITPQLPCNTQHQYKNG